MEQCMPAFDANLFNIEQLDAVASQLQAQPQSYLPFHQYLPTLTQHLSQAVESLQRNQKKLLDEAIPGFYHLQRMEEISGSGETEIDQAIKRLSKEFPAHFNEISHLIKFGQRLQSLIQMGRQIQSCDPGIISALQGAFQVLPSMRATLISRSMLVTSQPNAVLKKGNLFSTEVRLLLDIAAASPTVRIRIIALSDAERLVAGAAQCNQVSYEATIVNNQATFEKKEDALISQFAKQPTLKEIGARGQAGAAKKVTVTEQKFVLLYEILSSDAIRTLLNYAGPIWAVSLPIVLIVHANQFCDAYSTIVWDRAFKNEEQVEWPRMCWLLKVIFANLTGAKNRKLSDADLNYFRLKMNISKDMPMVTYQRFAKDKIASGIKFSFWTWFYSICTLINSDLLPYWEKGCLMGFLSREEISQKLGSMNMPAFLLRFSDSQLGTVSVSSFKHDGTGAMKHLPFLLESEKLEKAGSLIELLRDFDQLRAVRHFCDKDYVMKDKGFFFEDPDLQTKKKDADAGPTATGYHKIKMVMKGGDDDEDDASDRTPSTLASPEVFYPSRSPTRSPSDSMLRSPYADAATVQSPYFVGEQQNSPYSPYNMSSAQNISGNPNSPACNISSGIASSPVNGGYLSHSAPFLQGNGFPQSPQNYGGQTSFQNSMSCADDDVLDFFPNIQLNNMNGPSFYVETLGQESATGDDFSSAYASSITRNLSHMEVSDVDSDLNEAKKLKRS